MNNDFNQALKVSSVSGPAQNIQNAPFTVEERRAFTQRSTERALAIFMGFLCLWAATAVLAVASLPVWANVFFAVWVGFFTGALFVVGHDALHQSFTSYRWLNSWIGRISLLPACYSASLWVLWHNRTHHRYTNLKGKDGHWEPWSPSEYAAAPLLRRTLYRLYRSPLGPPFYHLFELALHHAIPIKQPSRREWRQHLPDTLFVVIGYPTLIAGIIWLGTVLAPDRPLWQTAAFGWLIPFIAWNWVYGFVIYLHHNHPRIPWFSNEDDWTFHRAQVLGTTETRLPAPLQIFSNNIMEHTAHHAYPGIPLYHLAQAQKQIRKKFPDLIFTNATQEYFSIVRACKLFDYEKRQWFDFNGNPTGPILPLDGHSEKQTPPPLRGGRSTI